MDELLSRITMQVAASLFNRQIIIPATNVDMNSLYSRTQGFVTALGPDYNLETLQKSKALILGAGAIGSHTAWSLAAAGITELAIVDFDVVEESNLNRQLYERSDIGKIKVSILAKRLQSINPDLHVKPIAKRITSEMEIRNLIKLERPTAVIEAIDDPPAAAVWSNRACLKERIPLIRGGFIGTSWFVGPTVIPGKIACIECIQGRDSVDAKRINGMGPTLSAVTEEASGALAGEFIRIVLGMKAKFCDRVTVTEFNGHTTYQTVNNIKPCKICGYHKESTNNISQKLATAFFLLAMATIPFFNLTRSWNFSKPLILLECSHLLLISVRQQSERHQLAFKGTILYAFVNLAETIFTATSRGILRSQPILFQLSEQLSIGLVALCLTVVLSQITCGIIDLLQKLLLTICCKISQKAS